MATVNAIPAAKAPADLKPVYENLTKTFGRVPGIFGVMAHRDQIVELTLVVCVANFTNRFNDGLQIEADIG